MTSAASGPVAKSPSPWTTSWSSSDAPDRDLHGQEHGVGGGGRRKPVGGVPAPFCQGVLLPGPLLHLGVRVARGQRSRHRRTIPGRQRALRPLAPEPGRRDRVHRRHEPCRHEDRVGAPARHLRRGARHLRGHARDDRHGLHHPLLHAPFLRGGTGRLRLGRGALRGLHRICQEDVRGHARPLRDRGGELPGPRLCGGGPRRTGRLPPAPGGRHRRPAAPDQAGHRPHLLGAQPAHGGAQPLAGRARRPSRSGAATVAAPARRSSSTRCRTAFGKRGGALANWHPVDLLALPSAPGEPHRRRPRACRRRHRRLREPGGRAVDQRGPQRLGGGRPAAVGSRRPPSTASAGPRSRPCTSPPRAW